MSSTATIPTAAPTLPTGDTRSTVKYPAHSPLWVELNRRVNAYFEAHGTGTDGGLRIRFKSAVIITWLVASYVGLVFFAETWWQVLPLGISLSLAVAGVGFNIQHDGGHDAYAKTRRINRMTAWTLDMVGGSSYVWRHKHSVIHHYYTNIDGVDEDIDCAPFMRLSPQQPRRWAHRFQHVYAWPLFGFLLPKWAFYDDFVSVFTGRVGSQTIPRPRGSDLFLFVLGKLLFVSWVFAVPLLVGHSVGHVLAVYGFCALVTGICISIVFQSAHCVEEAEFPSAPVAGERMPRGWAEHQLATTVDFAPKNPLLTWYLGGLTHQIEHHLFPRISHVHYAALAPIVRETCAEFGVAHRTHPHFRNAIASHMRHLYRLGRPTSVATA